MCVYVSGQLISKELVRFQQMSKYINQCLIDNSTLKMHMFVGVSQTGSFVFSQTIKDQRSLGIQKPLASCCFLLGPHIVNSLITLGILPVKRWGAQDLDCEWFQHIFLSRNKYTTFFFKVQGMFFFSQSNYTKLPGLQNRFRKQIPAL